MKNILFAVVIILVLNSTSFSQFNTLIDSVRPELKKEIKKQMEEYNEENNVINFGLSIGYRWTLASKVNNSYVDPSISPIDSTLQLDNRDKSALILGAVIMARPFGGNIGKNILILAQLNIANFSNQQLSSLTTQSIEGGIGFGYQFNSNISLGITFDRVFNRSLRAYILQKVNQKIYNGGNVVTNLSDKSDNNIFQDDNLVGISFKIIYQFGK